MKELLVPMNVLEAPHSQEIVRIRTSGDKQIFACRPTIWADPAAWGLLLVDLARQIAAGYCQEPGTETASVLKRIKAGIDAEWSTPT
jgi:hypothetical protein